MRYLYCIFKRIYAISQSIVVFDIDLYKGGLKKIRDDSSILSFDMHYQKLWDGEELCSEPDEMLGAAPQSSTQRVLEGAFKLG